MKNHSAGFLAAFFLAGGFFGCDPAGEGDEEKPGENTAFVNPSAVHCGLDEDTVIWLGTDSGLTRFRPGDGSWMTVRPRTHSQASDDVWSIAPDGDGGLWLGTGSSGLARYRGGTWENRAFPDSQPTRFNRLEIKVDSSKNLWAIRWKQDIRTNRDGKDSDSKIYRFDGTLWKSFQVTDLPIPESLNRFGSPEAVTTDAAGHIWVASYAGLLGFDGATWTFNEGRREDMSWVSLAALPDGKKWGQYQNKFDGGICRFEAGTCVYPENVHLGNGPSGIYGSAMCVARDGALWISYNQNLARYRADGLVLYPNDGVIWPAKATPGVWIAGESSIRLVGADQPRKADFPGR